MIVILRVERNTDKALRFHGLRGRHRAFGVFRVFREGVSCVRETCDFGGFLGLNHFRNVAMSERQNSFNYEDLLACGRGELFGEGNAQLPLPPMLMFDRISEISETGGPNGKGMIRAELDVKPDLWFFACHFKGDPVMPGCLGLDALWQMLGFFLGWLGAPGKGRALGMGEVKFSGQVLPTVKNIVYGIDIKRVMRSKLVLGIADGWLSADGEVIYRASDLKVGLFKADEMLAAPAKA